MNFKWFGKRKFIPENVVLEVDVPDDITDEIEKALLELKEAYDLPTEEVEISIESRKKARLFKFRNIQ